MEVTIPFVLERIAREHPHVVAQMYKDDNESFRSIAYAEFATQVEEVAAGLYSLGLRPGGHAGLISENRREWFLFDLGVLSLRAADVPRGCDATDDEIVFILDTADVEICAVEHQHQLDRTKQLFSRLPKLKTIIVLDPAFADGGKRDGVEVVPFRDVLERGRNLLNGEPTVIRDIVAQGSTDDIATIIFTSGTTGEPKGVMLSHGAFLNQVKHVPDLIHVGPGDIWLCVLPVWHSFERIMQYVALGSASALAYSKPVGKIMLEDFQKVRPTWMASVPRIWEAVRAGIYRNIKSQSAVTRAIFFFFVAVGGAYAHARNLVRGYLPRFRRRIRLLDALLGIVPLILLFPFKKLGDLLVFRKIQARLGGRFVAGISGGGALPAAVDRFFSAAGILLLEGYGLTETAPVLGVRAQDHPVPGTVGPIFPEMEIKVVGEDGSSLPPGVQGLVFARGPQVMKGYYKRPDLTAEVIDSDGWFDTGDLGVLTHDNELKITGRAKDTIVLLGGENVEPNPIEEKLRESEFIAQAILLGQDQKFLGALLVPEFDILEEWAASEKVEWGDDRAKLVTTAEVKAKYDGIVRSLISAQNGFKPFERVAKVGLLSVTFELGKELSAKQEVKRHVVHDLYSHEIDAIFA